MSETIILKQDYFTKNLNLVLPNGQVRELDAPVKYRNIRLVAAVLNNIGYRVVFEGVSSQEVKL